MPNNTRIRVAALCVISAALAGSIAAGGRLQAQAGPTPMGTLVIKVPRGLLPSQDYWLYVNGQMVSGPPYPAFASMSNGFHHMVAAPRDQFWDSRGLAASSEAGRFTFLRDGLREGLFETQAPMQRAAGKCVVELLTRAVSKPFPFGIARIETQIAAGATEVIEFGIPPGTSEMRIEAVRGTAIGPPDWMLENVHKDLNRTVQEFGKSPIAAVLNEMLLTLAITPGRRPTISAPLSAAMGGGRELDAQQVSLTIAGLSHDYGFRSISDEDRFQNAASPTPELAAALTVSINRHNARIDKFQQIVKALEQAKR